MNRLGRHVLAAYYNDARVSILYCLNDVREKTGLAPIRDEANILNGLDTLSLTTATPEHQRERIRLLRNRFRFIDPATDFRPDAKNPDAVLTDPAHYERLLRWVFRLISDQRNTLVHPTEPEATITPRVHKDLFFALGKIYDSSLREVAKRFTLAPDVIQPLQRCGKGAQLKPLSRFSLALCSDPATSKNSGNLLPSEVLSDFGRVLLCALFLDKGQVAELASYFWQAGYDHHWDGQQQAIVRELLGVYRVHLPIQRLQVDDTVTAVTIDTLAELSRCPRPLLDALDPKDQARFRTGPSLAEPDAKDRDEEGDEGEDEASLLLVRGHRDRFVPLMMRFLDFDPENRLRFAVDLGQYFYNVRLKPGDRYTDGRPRVRRLARKVLAYGRLAAFDTAPKPDTWQRLEANYGRSSDDEQTAIQQGSGAIEPLLPYVVPCLPHYHYADDKIGLRLADANASVTYPALSIADAADLRAGRPSGRDTEPEFWASPDQLLDLGFYAYLRKTNSRFRRLDEVLNRYRGGMRRLLEALQGGGPNPAGAPGSVERRAAAQQWIDGLFGRAGSDDFAVALADLPKVITHHLLGFDTRPPVADDIHQRVAHLIEDTERRRRQLDHLLEAVSAHPGHGRGRHGHHQCGAL
jgi:hypothetical protein